jgi:hypothetical protein
MDAPFRDQSDAGSLYHSGRAILPEFAFFTRPGESQVDDAASRTLTWMNYSGCFDTGLSWDKLSNRQLIP